MNEDNNKVSPPNQIERLCVEYAAGLRDFEVLKDSDEFKAENLQRIIGMASRKNAQKRFPRWLGEAVAIVRECVRLGINLVKIFWLLCHMKDQRKRSDCRSLFSQIELFFRILPAKIRVQAFEPAYNDEKASFLRDRRRFKSGCARKWLTFWFVLHVALMIGQCLWGMCSDKAKRLVLTLLPGAFRNRFGS